MSQENVEIVRAMYEPFARGDFSAWAELPDYFEFVISPELPDAGTYRGTAAARWMTAWVQSFEGHTIEATEILDAGGDKWWSQSSNGVALAEAKQRWRAIGGL